MKPFYQTLQKSCKTFFNNFKSVIVILIVDIIFFLCLATVYAKVWEKAMVHVNYILEIADIGMAELAEKQTEAQLSAFLAKQGEFMVHYRQISYYIGMLLVALLAFWCVFHAISWFITHSIIKEKKYNFFRFFGKFLLLSSLWWVVFIIIMAIGIRLSMYSSMAVLPYVGGAGAKIVVLALLFALFYLSYISYALIPKYNLKHLFKEMLRTAYCQYKTLVPVYLFMAVVLVGEYFLFLRSFVFGGYAPVIFALVIIFPTAAWTRFYAITAVKGDAKQGVG